MDRGESPVRRGARVRGDGDAFAEAVDAKRREKITTGARGGDQRLRAFAGRSRGEAHLAGRSSLGSSSISRRARVRGSPGRGRPSPRPRAPPAAGRFRPPRSRAGRRPRSSGGSAARPPSAKAARGNARGRGGGCADERDPRTLSDARPRGARGNDPIPRRRPLGLKEQASRRDEVARARISSSSGEQPACRRGARGADASAVVSLQHASLVRTTRREARVSPDLSAGRRVRPARFCSRARRSPRPRRARSVGG